VNQLKKTTRQEIAQQLTQLLADTYKTFNQTQNFHWNVESPFFRSRHLLFEDQYREMFEAIDVIAERIRILGFYTPGSLQQLLTLGDVTQRDEQMAGPKMLETLIDQHEGIIRRLRTLADLAGEHKDEATLDLAVERLRVHEKTVWMLRSHTDEASTPLENLAAQPVGV
jgi:starvation-inducible DNA-binding protein